ncbi:MAG TPA: FG-GAP-like repeat-containing protein, partial [Pyrinomonadaceae bacterium]|nr:FG-GAP-like repeat-containing protein [Pyrinomonadaceae bacterium]
NAQEAAPTFTRLFNTGTGAEQGRAELAIQKTGNTVTVYVAHGTGAANSTGQLSKVSYDTAAPATPTFTLAIDNNFCSPQCFYNMAVAVDPNDANRVYLGGSPTVAFAISTNGGTSFTRSEAGLHVDTHAIAVAPSDPNILYFGSDGGVWRSANQGGTWTSLNNSTLSSVQFQSIAVHPRDRHYLLGGTQDNGTNYFLPSGTTWTRAVGGDGGFVVIDSGSQSPTSLTSYHTFFNTTGTQIGFARSTATQISGQPIYGGLLGCVNNNSNNGIVCADSTLFYAPLALGPNATGSTGNTVYFGSNKLYRSINQGTLMTPVSQTLPGNGERVSAIGISPQNDDVRLIGSTLGRVYYSNTTVATTMTDISVGLPGRYVGRIAISPVDQNTAYVALGGFGIPGRHVMKTTNLNAATPTWVDAGSGIPDIPTNGLVIDPQNPNTLYAGTDIGVFVSTDGAVTWQPFSNGLPRVAVFEIVLQPSSRVLKIGTHGRGVYEYELAPTARPPADFDGDGKSDLSVFRPGDGNWFRRSSQTGADVGTPWGIPGDKLVPGDYDGDGKADLAVYRAATGNWHLNRSRDGITQANFGLPTDLPAQGDYDGDGKTDLAVFRPADGIWFISQSRDGFTVQQFGANGDKPVAGDYDGDGKTDIAVYRPSLGTWFIQRSRDGFTSAAYGVATDKVVPGDYDGDGKTDIALFRESNATWYYLRSRDGDGAIQWGSPGDIPTPGDFDGDGKFDVSVFRPSDGIWYRLNSANSQFFGAQFGATGDLTIPAAYLPVQ